MDGPIKKYKDHRALNEKRIRDAMDAAEGKPKKKKKEEKKNPYPEGSYRAKAWARREADRAKQK
jgi:hypothetical protein